jgi:hypothetical protein
MGRRLQTSDHVSPKTGKIAFGIAAASTLRGIAAQAMIVTHASGAVCFEHFDRLLGRIHFSVQSAQAHNGGCRSTVSSSKLSPWNQRVTGQSSDPSRLRRSNHNPLEIPKRNGYPAYEIRATPTALD